MANETTPLYTATSDDVKLWRYMDVSKFIYLLSTRSLYFPRADKLGDPFEGSYPLPVYEMFKKAFESNFNAEVRDEKITQKDAEEMKANLTKERSEFFKNLKKCVYILSFNQSERESAAMWSQYLKSEQGIAIQTTLSRLRNSLRGTTFLVETVPVEYIDYEKGEFPEYKTIWVPFKFKRVSFEHEAELRAIIVRYDNFIEISMKKEKTYDEGCAIKIDLKEFLTAIYVSPTSKPWFKELVQNIVSTYGLDKNLVQISDLNRDPLF